LGLTTLQFVPWIYVAENTRNATMVSAGAFAFLFSICSALQPFNGSWSPNKLMMKQEYNATEALVTVTVSTATGLYSALKAALPAREFDTVECGPFKKHLTSCTYQTDLLPKYAGNETLNEFVLSEVEKTCDGTTCIASATYSSKNSLLCRVYFDPATNSEPISHAWINDREIKENNISALFSYINDYERPVNVKVEYPEGKSPEATFSCYYDEWTEREIPAFSYLRENLPENSILLIRGQGLVLAHYARVSL
jgi:hypothetical protein